MDQGGVAPGDNETDGGRVAVSVRESMGEEMTFKVIDAYDWESRGKGQSLCEVDTNQQRAHEPGPVRYSDSVQVAEGQTYVG